MGGARGGREGGIRTALSPSLTLSKAEKPPLIGDEGGQCHPDVLTHQKAGKSVKSDLLSFRANLTFEDALKIYIYTLKLPNWYCKRINSGSRRPGSETDKLVKLDPRSFFSYWTHGVLHVRVVV